MIGLPAVEMWKTFRRLQVYHIPTATTAATTTAGSVMSITLISSTRGLDKGVNLTVPTQYPECC